ncbi:MAG: DUF4388 domain-containing protein [Gloeomargarita sp. DG02_4_bins_56]
MQGRLSEIPLAEVLKLLGQGQATGVLELQPMRYQLWWQAGKMVGALAPGFSLHQLMMSQGGVSASVLQVAMRAYVVAGSKSPFGVWLVERYGWQWRELQWLFHQQVVRPVCRLLGAAEARFEFRPRQALPLAHLTGLSAEPLEVLLAGLRALRDWRVLFDQLPEPASALVSRYQGRPPYRLNHQEWHLWEYADGETSLASIAQAWQVEVLTVQQVAFRLMSVGLVAELPLLATAKQLGAASASELTGDFLESLAQSLQQL